MSEHDHPHPPETQDAGSQALSEALRSSFAIVKVAMVVLVITIFAAGFFQVGPQEKAIILRFGNPQGEGQKMLLSAGLHWSLPYPIDEVVRIPITEIQKVTTTIGWYPTSPEMELAGTEPPAGPSLNPAFEGYVITADRNIVHTRATVSYHIDDPRTAVFNFASGTNHEFSLAGISNALLNAANNALVATAAKFTVEDIILHDTYGFQDAVRAHVAHLADQEHLGVIIDQCVVQSAPPRQLKGVFAMVTTARQNYAKQINDARSEESRILNQASAQAKSITDSAESRRIRFVTSINADAETFSKLLPQYQSNPQLYAQLELAKAMPQMLTNVEKNFLPARADGDSIELRLLLNREPPQPRSANP